jgi:hypothetical protein
LKEKSTYMIRSRSRSRSIKKREERSMMIMCLDINFQKTVNKRSNLRDY